MDAVVACRPRHHRHKLPVMTGSDMRAIKGDEIMLQQLKWAAAVAVAGVLASPATAQEKLKVGVIVTLSGPAAALGAQVRDGFALAVKDLGGKMGGRDVEVVVVDD